MRKIRFGPAGIPTQCQGNTTLDGVRCCSLLGLGAMEMEFVQGVRLKEEMAKEIRVVANELDISLSSHAPYFINFCSDDKTKIETSIRNLVHSAHITSAAGGRITVFHPGFYQKKTKESAYSSAKKNIQKAVALLEGTGVVLGAETVGKKTAFGGLQEVVRLSQEIPELKPVLDFAHLHARGDWTLKTAEDYGKLFGFLETSLGDYVMEFHAHFSEINYNEKGERNHLSLGTNNEPPFRPLLKMLHENGYSGTIICESPMLDLDAQKMQKYLDQIFRRASPAEARGSMQAHGIRLQLFGVPEQWTTNRCVDLSVIRKILTKSSRRFTRQRDGRYYCRLCDGLVV